MQDLILADLNEKTDSRIAWKHNAGFGYEHTPSDLVEKDGRFFWN